MILTSFNFSPALFWSFCIVREIRICSNVIVLASLPPACISWLNGTDAVSCRLGNSHYNSAALHQLGILGKYPRKTQILFKHWQRLLCFPSAFPQTHELSPGSPEDVPAYPAPWDTPAVQPPRGMGYAVPPLGCCGEDLGDLEHLLQVPTALV